MLGGALIRTSRFTCQWLGSSNPTPSSKAATAAIQPATTTAMKRSVERWEGGLEAAECAPTVAGVDLDIEVSPPLKGGRGAVQPGLRFGGVVAERQAFGGRRAWPALVALREVTSARLGMPTVWARRTRW